MTPPAKLPARPHALIYIRVSTEGQADSGAGLAAQLRACEPAAQQRDWTYEVISEMASGGRSDRPELAGALARLDKGEAHALIVAKLDRLSRSLSAGAAVIERAQRRGWALVALDLGVDLSTTAGEMTAGMLLVMARAERRMISDRTRAALAERKAAGVKLGRPSGLDSATEARIRSEHLAGRSMRQIADGLNTDGVETSRGGNIWRHTSVNAVLRRLRVAA